MKAITKQRWELLERVLAAGTEGYQAKNMWETRALDYLSAIRICRCEVSSTPVIFRWWLTARGLGVLSAHRNRMAQRQRIRESEL